MIPLEDTKHVTPPVGRTQIDRPYNFALYAAPVDTSIPHAGVLLCVKGACVARAIGHPTKALPML